MALEQIKVREIVLRAVNKEVDIPEFQRDFIWDPEQVKLLVESLYRDYPVGSFLLWESSGYEEAKTAQGGAGSLWIVDGQQRIAALCLLLGRKPYWWPTAKDWNETLGRYDVMANLLPEGGSERLLFALANPIRRKDPRWVSVRRVLDIDKVEHLTPLAQEITNQIGGDPTKMELFARIHAGLQRLWQIRDRDIPVIKTNHEVEDVAEIFARLNQEGTRVKEADVVLALAAVRNPGWVRQYYLPFRTDLEDQGWDLDAGIYIRTMTSIGHGRARLVEVPEDLWKPDKLVPVWQQARTAIAEVLKRLAQRGILSGDLLPSTNSLIPLFTLHHRWGNEPGYNFDKAFRWFLLATRDGRYSGSAITSLNEDVRAIAESQGFDDSIAELLKRLRVSPDIDEKEFRERYDRAGNRFLLLLLYLLIHRHDATDWVDGVRIGYDKTGSPISLGFKPQWHHIYPRSMLKKADFSDDEVNAIANITVLNERTNVSRLANKEPWRYIGEFQIPPQALCSHFIPADFAQAPSQEQWSPDNYEEFLLQRAEWLACEANELLRQLEEQR